MIDEVNTNTACTSIEKSHNEATKKSSKHKSVIICACLLHEQLL